MVLSSQVLALLAFLTVSALALPQPEPNPAPEPFFGLLGRLLAASFSGEKENDKGNCACRRTFHQKEKKEKDKDKGCSCDTPVSYNPPSYSAPQTYEPVDSYGAPIAPVYGAPDTGCNCACDRTFHQKEKKNKDKDKKCNCSCNDGYSAPQSYAPVESYGAPSSSYGAPVDSYGAPAPSYGAPSSVCACSRTFHQKEKNNKDKDKKNQNQCDCSGYPTYEYAAPSYEYSAPVSYQAPSTGYGAPSTSYGAPSSSYGAPSYNPPCSRRRTFHQKEKNKDKDKKNPCAYYY